MYHYEENKQRFWRYLEGRVDSYPPHRGRKNRAAFALFSALSEAFTDCDKMSGLVPVHRELVQYLAGYATECLEGEPEGGVIHPNANHFLKRSYDGFFETVRGAIKEKQLRHFEDGRILYGCLELPKWLVDFYANEAAQEAENLRKIREKFGSPPPVTVVRQ